MDSVVETPGGSMPIWIWVIIGIFSILAIAGIYRFLLSKKKDTTMKTSSSNSEPIISKNEANYTSSRRSKIDERRILISYIVAICAPLVLGGYGIGIGHLVVCKYKRGILILLGTIVLMFAIVWFLVGWPLVGADYTLPWAEYDEWDGGVLVESLWPGILITMLSGFLMWILQNIDLIRVNKKLVITQNLASSSVSPFQADLGEK